MSGRGGRGAGGGGRGRGQDYGHGQPSSGFPRGGGGGRGRGRDSSGGRSSGPPPSSSSYTTLPPSQVAPTQPPPTSVPPATALVSSGVESELSQKLTLEPQVPARVPHIPSSSKAIVRFPPRPGFGTVGRVCRVRANHFLVNIADSTDLHHYNVSITPEITSKKLNRTVMKQLIDLHKDSHLGSRRPAYDGRKSLYTAGALPFDSKEFAIKLIDEDRSHGSSSSVRKERNFKVAIKLVSKPDIHYLREFLNRRHLECPQETIQALDVALRASPSANYTVVGRSFFHPKLDGKGELGNGIEYWKGYYQSLRPTQMGLSLNIDVSARSFYEQILVTDFVAKHFRRPNLSRPLSDQDRMKVRKALKGVRCELEHLQNAKTCKIAGISREPISQLKFTLDDNRTEMSVVQYFQEKYNISLKYTFLPALQCGSEARPIYLPMELCRIVGGQRYTKKLNDQQVKAMLNATCERPHVREGKIQKMVRVNNFQEDVCVNKEFGIQVKEELALFNARVLPAPRLKYHESGRESSVNPVSGAWNMINKKMVNGGRVDFWSCVNFSVEYAPMSKEFCRQLVNMCNSKGMVISETASTSIRSARPDKIDQSLKDVFKESIGRPLQLLIVILPDQTGSYGKIKRICETELGIVSQCCQPKQAAKFSNQYFENLAMKMNVKVGGRNTVLDDAIRKRIPLVSDCPTIIFGADVTHPQAGEDSTCSIAAVVASMDWPEVTKYRGLVSAQPHREEIIQDLYKKVQDPQKGVVHSGMIRELLVAFYKSTGQKPGRIIFYRDGVSEGQFAQVMLFEIDSIRKACASLQEDYMPRVTFIVVQKRHNTRLFPADKQMDRSGNIQAGTVVDTSICHPTEFDFYLNSHAGIKGTSRPTHYHVLYDENKFTADILQVLTNNLCYTYARCTRSVSVVPPAYYAHLAAFRARYYIEDESSESGSTGGQSQRVNAGNNEVRSLPSIKDNVKEVMFYV